jgi:[FeFe] hydrogenase H-cluster maturation GTPase HydF
MTQAPKGMHLQVGFFGRVNTGKSTLLNLVAGQDAALTSPEPGTTTDVVERAMELLPLGPVLFLDTAGVGDETALGEAREERTFRAMRRSDVAVIVTDSGSWGQPEERLARETHEQGAGLVLVITKVDLNPPEEAFLAQLRAISPFLVCVNSTDPAGRDAFLNAFKAALAAAAPAEQAPPLLGDLIRPGGFLVMVVPIDLQAPKGRLILPQVQAIREVLDNDATVVVVKERELSHALDNMRQPPDLVVCDSQAVLKAAADTPSVIPLTTFSILFARLKGELDALAGGAAAIHRLKPGDRVLVAEACTHHALADDIGRVKIPRWLRRFTGLDLLVEHCCGCSFPAELGRYRLVIHCGACMLNRRAMLRRVHDAKRSNVPVTNYGIAISVLQGVIERSLQPFPSAQAAYRAAIELPTIAALTQREDQEHRHV